MLLRNFIGVPIIGWKLAVAYNDIPLSKQGMDREVAERASDKLKEGLLEADLGSIVEAKENLASLDNEINLLPALESEIEKLKSGMSEEDKIILGGDLTTRLKTLTTGKRELKERLKIDLSTVTAKINALPIKKEVGKNHIKALALELTNCEIYLRESETMISQDIGKCKEKLAGSKYLTMQERNAMASEIFVINILINGMEGAMKTVESAEKEIEELKMGLTEEEHQIFDREIMQQKITTSSEARGLI
ncbi:hypothetical protein BdWA1_003348 [Babesia duncani]|uniref:Uncharacterized protein n=1 Tax=Babesia duncani TaxID=323732 RepID=A0AAD9PHV6_9APIC|nr:hypothetical protein BdWA1_003860 [Babesia duncani]KAK2195048.1 hypothetical protein BdWA1_003348 [Babesia duncani]